MTVEVKIGVSESSRELVVNSTQSPAEVEALVSTAFAGKDGVLSLEDEKGRKYLIQAAKVSYVEIGPSDARKVGFATS
ncbi:ATP-binding protein [Rhodococcus sp. Leaf278]|nr:ATP-binding protein [Rhodococcus sp. Leaf278]